MGRFLYFKHHFIPYKLVNALIPLKSSHDILCELVQFETCNKVTSEQKWMKNALGDIPEKFYKKKKINVIVTLRGREMWF